jgi:Arc/MetJ-type ribon-helix-helix transcriptional regulator
VPILRLSGGDLMTKKGDTQLVLSASLSAKIKQIMKASNGSYESMTEFVRAAIREKIERIESDKIR